MPASDAQIRASKANGACSKGPLSAETRAISSRNSLKHGLTGAGIVLPDEDVSEVERLSQAFENEFDVDGEAGRALARRMAVLAVRMDRCVLQDFAASAERIRKALDEFIPPEGVDAETAERLRVEAGKIALFDASGPACLARKYEAAAERGFFRALKELRALKKASKAVDPVAQVAAQAKASMAQLGSFLPAASSAQPAPLKPVPTPSKPVPMPPKAVINPPQTTTAYWDPFALDSSYVPISIGRPR
jgi:hypothetical protein